jgi:hypothetical protein
MFETSDQSFGLAIGGQMKIQSMLALVLLGAVLPGTNAWADVYDIKFLDGTSTTVDGTGQFTYSGGTFSGFTTSWDGLTFDLTAQANSFAQRGDIFGCGASQTLSFIASLLNSCKSLDPGKYTWLAYELSVDSANGFTLQTAPGIGPQINNIPDGTAINGSLSQLGDDQITDITVAATPEPKYSALMGTMLAIVFLAYRRKSHSAPTQR